MSYPEQLRKLTRRADATAASAAELVARAIRGIRAELALLSEELNIGGSAADRERAYATIRERMAALSGRLDRLLRAQNELAGKYAAKAAARMTGLEVKFSARRAEAIMELVTPAQGENLAAVFTENMANHAINALREATVAALREQAVSGGTLREMGKALGRRWTDALREPPVFTDASGRTWDTATYLQMNVRTNSMRVYNDCLADDIARSTGSDFVRVSRGGNPTCRLCAPWEGAILSISGKASGFPSYEQARRAGCFHPNCVHTIEYADEAADAEEFALQRKFPVGAQADAEEMDERRYRMDQERYRRRGLSADEARLAVDRDNLADCIRHGLVRADARKLVDGLTDAQVTALCPDGNPPRFEPTKKATRADPHAADEKWVRGSRGGVVHVSRDADAAHLLEVCRVDSKDGLISTVTSTTKKVAERLAPKRRTIPKTPDEIRAMKIEDALKLEEIDDLVPDAVRRFSEAKLLNEEDHAKLVAIQERMKEIDKLLAERQDRTLISEWLDLQRKQVTLAKENKDRAFFRNIEAFGFSGNGCTVEVGKISKPRRNQFAVAKKAIESLYADGVFPRIPLSVSSLRGNDTRAYHQAGEIFICAYNKSSTIVHEVSHFVEFANKHVHERCLEFLRYRTAGEEALPLRQLTGNKEYGRDEMARPDHFFDPYCGKDYGNRSTEILSMGVERLTRDPLVFYNEDREYFRFCVGIIRGLL